MKKLFTFMLVSLLITTKLSAATYNVDIANTTDNITTLVASAVTAGNTDITIRIASGLTIGSTSTGVTITIPAAVTKLTFTAYGTGTMPVFYTAGLFTFTAPSAGAISNVILDGVKLISYGTSKSLIMSSTTLYPLGVTIQNCYIQGFRYVINGGSVTSTFTNGVFVNNNIFKGISQLMLGFSGIVNNQTYTNNTFIETSGGTLVDYRTVLNAGMNLNFSNNTFYSSGLTGSVNFGTNGLFRLVSDPGATGTYTFNNNLIVSGATATYAKGNYGAYSSLNFSTSYTTDNITYTGGSFTNIKTYPGSTVGTLFPNAASDNYTIGDINFSGKASVGDPRWYYPVSVPLSVTSLSGFSYNVGSATSPSQSFTLSAVALRSVVTLTAPTHYEISTDNVTYSNSLSVGTAGSDLSSTTLYVRLKSGLGFATYNNELITVVTSGLANQTISCSGTVLSGRTVLATPNGVNTSNITTGGFTASWNTVPNATGYSVNVYQGTSTITTVSGISGTTTDISGLTSGNTYTYKVLAVGDGISYDNSPESSATTIRLSGSYATDLFKTKTSGNWSDTSTWQSSPDGGNTWNDATLTPDATAASVSVSNDVTYAGTPATIGNTVVNSGATLINTTTPVAVATGKTLTIATGATLDNQLDNSSFSAGTGSAQVNGTFKISSYTGTSQLAFTNITFASGSTLYIGCPGAPRLAATNAGNVVWASTAGGSLLNSNPTTIAGNFIITSALGSALNHGTGNTVRTLTIGGNLIINGGAYNPQGGSGTGTQALTVNGNVYLSGAGKLYAVNPTVTGLGTISVGGNIYIQSPTDVALGAGVSTGVFSLAGISSQTITSDTSTGYAIGDMTLNNNTGLSLGSDLTINGALTLTAGKVTLGAKNLTVGSVVGATSSNYIVTDGAGALHQMVADGATKIFPVGASAASYDPASVTPVTGTTFGVRAYATLSGSAADGIGYNAKEWDITPVVASPTQIALTPSNLAVSVSSPVIGHYVNGAYVNNSNVTVSNGTFTGTFATFSPFVTGGNTVATSLHEGISNSTSVLAFNNQLMVKGTVINDLITVYGINGQVVAKVKAAGDQTILNLNQGIYLVNVKSANSSTNFKVVLN